MLETKEKYVTEEMLDRAFVKFGQSFRLVFRQDVKEIVDASVAVAIESAIDDFAVLMLKHFNRLDTKIDNLEEKMDTRFKDMEVRFDGVDQRLDNTNQRIDSHLLDCVSRTEHRKLEKRVDSIELSGRKIALR